MDGAAHERECPAVHGLVSPRLAVGAALGLCVATSLLAGVLGGLLRVGLAVPGLAPAAWLEKSALAHAALMMCGFLGSVIGVERAVSARHRAAFLAPVASGLCAVALLQGWNTAAAVLLLVAGIAFVGVNILLLCRQRAPHTVLLLASAFAWLVGNTLYAASAATAAVLPWWFTFLVMTIAAERLEMTRMMRRRPGAQAALVCVLCVLAVGATASAFSPPVGGLLFGGALLALAAWLLAFDIARRTVRAVGLPRYMAICLLGGYAWLGIGGFAWAASANGLVTRDTALHALGLGFIFSMVMGHAPVILPAIARTKLLFSPLFYLPLAALHASLLLRFGWGATALHWRAQGALFNALSLALFAATVLGAVLAWRSRRSARRRSEHSRNR